jgi:RIO kinase 1
MRAGRIAKRIQQKIDALMIELGNKISSKGGWCNIYEIIGHPELCAKVLARHRRYKGEFPDPEMIARKKYGINDMLQYELDNHQAILGRIPQRYHKFFVQMHGIKQTANGQRALIMECVRNAQGKVAKNLEQNTEKLAPDFFQNLETLRTKVFLRYSIDHFGLACRNILVRDTSSPVLIDFQNTIKRYRYQFWLRFPFFIRQKMNRRFQRVYKETGAPDFTRGETFLRPSAIRNRS